MVPQAAMAARDDAPQAAVAAQVAAQDGGPEAAVAASEEDLNNTQVTQPWKLNNAALKYFRDTNENPPGYPTRTSVQLTDTDPHPVGVLQRTTGEEYWFRPDETTPWSLRQMLAALTDDGKERVLGPKPRLGVASIVCKPVEGSYDHKRQAAAIKQGQPFDREAPTPVWDFFLTRTDGSVVRFHVSRGSKKVESADLSHPLTLSVPPKNGKGKSDGKGTYRSLKSGNYTARATQPRDLHVDIVRDAAEAAQGYAAGGGGADAVGVRVVDVTHANHGGGGSGGDPPHANHGGGGSSGDAAPTSPANLDGAQAPTSPANKTNDKQAAGLAPSDKTQEVVTVGGVLTMAVQPNDTDHHG